MTGEIDYGFSVDDEVDDGMLPPPPEAVDWAALVGDGSLPSAPTPEQLRALERGNAPSEPEIVWHAGPPPEQPEQTCGLCRHQRTCGLLRHSLGNFEFAGNGLWGGLGIRGTLGYSKRTLPPGMPMPCEGREFEPKATAAAIHHPLVGRLGLTDVRAPLPGERAAARKRAVDTDPLGAPPGPAPLRGAKPAPAEDDDWEDGDY